MSDMSFVEQYNKLFGEISKASTVDDVRSLLTAMKKFVAMYKNVDVTSVKRIYNKYLEKLHNLVEENSFVYDRLTTQAEKVRNRGYDFANEKDDTKAVQNKVLQLMAQLPKAKTSANIGTIASMITDTINTGTIGCKAVLELLKYPAYVDMITEHQRQDAFSGCKSEQEQAFDRLKETELKKVEQARANTYLQGFHLRNIEKQAIDFNKPSAWAV